MKCLFSPSVSAAVRLPLLLAGLPAAVLLLSLSFITGCAGEPAPEPEALPEPVVEAPSEPPKPFITEWAGTTWIFRDVPEGSREFPGYRGFHLARDGRLLLINMDEALGNTWDAEGNRLRMGLLDGVPSIPLEGFFLTFLPEDEDGPVSIRLVSEVLPESDGVILEQAKANVDVIENHWIPRTLEDGEKVSWPMNREIHLMLLPDATGGMGILGYGGENRFRGGIELGEEIFVVGPVAMTRRIGPASPFEDLYVRRISEADRYIQVDDDLFLYSETQPVAGFRVRLFD